VAGSGLTDADCQGKQFQRVVRRDASGTTFLFKRYLHAAANDAADGDRFDWRQPSYGGTLENNAWPNDSGATAVVRGASNGAGSQMDALSGLGANGGIGYADLSTARSKDYGWTYDGVSYDPNDTKVWLRVQRISNDNYNSPGVANAQNVSGANSASACLNVTYTGAPSADLGQAWDNATAVLTPTDYSICGLNFVVTSRWGFDTEASRYRKVWEGSDQGEFRAVRDYLRYVTGIIKPGTGPGHLPPAGYSKLPADLQATAQCASKLIGWNRAGSDGQPTDPVPRDPGNNDPNC
jgi:hypothetical protein